MIGGKQNITFSSSKGKKDDAKTYGPVNLTSLRKYHGAKTSWMQYPSM